MNVRSGFALLFWRVALGVRMFCGFFVLSCWRLFLVGRIAFVCLRTFLLWLGGQGGCPVSLFSVDLLLQLEVCGGVYVVALNFFRFLVGVFSFLVDVGVWCGAGDCQRGGGAISSL